MGDRFKELSQMALQELEAVFAKMDDSNVRELLEKIKKRLVFLSAPLLKLPAPVNDDFFLDSARTAFFIFYRSVV